MISIGIADDDALVRQTLSDLLSKNDDIVVTWTAKDGQDFSLCKTSFECWIVVYDCIDRSNNWWSYSKFRHVS